MSELENKKLGDEILAEVAGGNDGMGDGTFSVYDINPVWVMVTADSLNCRFSVYDINPVWVMVTADSLNCRYTPNGEIAKTYEYGHKLKVNGITTDGLWYRLWIYNPKGGECNGYIYKQYTQLI